MFVTLRAVIEECWQDICVHFIISGGAVAGRWLCQFVFFMEKNGTLRFLQNIPHGRECEIVAITGTARTILITVSEAYQCVGSGIILVGLPASWSAWGGARRRCTRLIEKIIMEITGQVMFGGRPGLSNLEIGVHSRWGTTSLRSLRS